MLRPSLLVAVVAARVDLRSQESLAAPGIVYCVLPATEHIPEGADCAAMGAEPRSQGDAGSPVEVDLMIGEAEHFQVLIEGHTPGKLALDFPTFPLHGDGITKMNAGGEDVVVPKVAFAWRQLGYVFCKQTERYEVSNASGWRPDPLLDDGMAALLDDGSHAVLWVTAKAPVWSATAVAAAANASSTAWISEKTDYLKVSVATTHGLVAVQVPILVKVWPVILPDNVNARVTQYWNFMGLEQHQEHLYDKFDPVSEEKVEKGYFSVLAEHRVPANDFERVDEEGWLATATHTAHVSLRLPTEPKCNTDFDALDGVVKTAMDEFEPIVTKATAFVNKYNEAHPNVKPRSLAVYVYDEAEESCLPVLRSVLGAIKSHWPNMTTISPLNWKVPIDLPLDVHVMEYDKYVDDFAEHGRKRVDEGKKMWLYHCVEPSKKQYMNTFIESPLMGSRLLFWLAAIQPEISGWLYWSEASWMSCPDHGDALKQFIKRKAKPESFAEKMNDDIRYGPGAGGQGGGARTDFDPAMYWECLNPEYGDSVFTNGDGYVVYPGDKGPVESARLHVIRDGIEDVELLRLLPDGAELAQRLVQGPTQWQPPNGPPHDELRAVRYEALERAARAMKPGAKAAKAPAPDLRRVAVTATGELAEQ